jgi:hypothetical protein
MKADYVLARADRAIDESRFLRDEKQKTLASARTAIVRVRATLLKTCAERERSVSLCCEAANQAVAILEGRKNPAHTRGP